MELKNAFRVLANGAKSRKHLQQPVRKPGQLTGEHRDAHSDHGNTSAYL